MRGLFDQEIVDFVKGGKMIGVSGEIRSREASMGPRIELSSLFRALSSPQSVSGVIHIKMPALRMYAARGLGIVSARIAAIVCAYAEGRLILFGDIEGRLYCGLATYVA